MNRPYAQRIIRTHDQPREDGHVRLGCVPVGLDGNPNPLVATERTAVLCAVADLILDWQRAPYPMLVAVDGIDVSGKSTFADELKLSTL